MAVFIYLVVLFQTQVSGWELFENTRYEWQYIEEMEREAELPIFDEKVKAMEGKAITLTGYYLPFDIDGNRIILSKLPYAACFFCGGDAGLESVAEIQFKIDPPRFMLDEMVTVKGKLKLNEREYGHLIFILEDASVVFSPR